MTEKTEQPQTNENAKKGRSGGLPKGFAIIIVLIICMVFFSILSPLFFTSSNLLNILWQNSYMVVASLGMTILLIGGGVDLSMGYIMGFGGVMAAMAVVNWGLPIWVAVVLCIGICTLLSCVNGILMIKLKINAMMVTLATMTIFSGLSYMFTDQKAIFNLPAAFKVIGQGSLGPIPIPAIIMIAAIVLSMFLLNSTFMGRYIYAIGGNPEAARLAGINVNKMRFLVFLIAGVCFGVAALLLVTRTGSANSGMAAGNEFTAITAAVLGGVAIQGGEGKIWSVVVAAFILGILSNGMQLIGMGTYVQSVVRGAILLIAMGAGAYQRMREASVKTA